MDKLVIAQIDRYLEPFNILKKIPRPKIGWIRYIRKSLGMSAEQLGRRAKISKRRINQLQQQELDYAINLKTLKHIANAMNCEFVYAIVPKKSIQQALYDQAKKIAIEHLKNVSHNMDLEQQKVLDQKMVNLQFEELVKQYLDGKLKYIWNE